MATKKTVEKKVAAAKAPRAAKAPKKAASEGTRGRQASDETQELLKKMTSMASRKSGVSNIDVANELAISTLKASNLGHRMVKAGVLQLQKGENGRVVYTKAA